MSAAALDGLVLAGGHSRRMQRDKATLPYDGVPQLARAVQLLRPLVSSCWVSVRADQQHDPNRSAYPTIADLLPDLGPIGGIHAAQHAQPQHAWLILACDLPFLDSATLQNLIRHRDPSRLATAYRSSFDQQPEPLCAIFEPASAAPLAAWIEQGQRCPRGFLAQADAALLELPAAGALENVNSAEEYAAASARALSGAAPRRLQVRYFALLREQAGRSSEELYSDARTPAELYAQLQARHGLTLAPQFLRVAINEQFGDWNAPLADADCIAFLPPVAGG